MNAVTGFAKGLSRFASPAYYAGEYAKVVKSVSADFGAGSVRPLFQGMLLVGVVGYTMEYIAIGRYHVMDKQAAVKKALADLHH